MGTSSKQKGKGPEGPAAKPRPKARRPTKAQRVALERRARQRRAIAGVLVAGLVVVVAVAVVRSRDGSSSGTPSSAGAVSIDRSVDAGPLEQGDRMPAFRAPGIGGTEVSWEAGEPTVVAVWAPWCPHCQKELPVVADVTGEFPSVELVSVATSIGTQPSQYTPESYMRERGLDFPVALDDADETLARGLGVTGFPTLFAVDAEGTVRATGAGEVSADDLRALIDRVA